MVNQAKVAKLAGVSFITVSRVVNNKGNVKAETRERVLSAIKELGYYPNNLGRALSSNKTKTIGMRLRGGISNDFMSALLTGIEGSCKKNGYNLLLNFGTDDKSDLSLFFERKVDGLIFYLTNLTEEDIKIIEKNKIPCVGLWGDVNSKSVVSIYPDNVKGGFLATEHLIELGHKKIYHIYGQQENKCAKERREGYMLAMKKHNIDVKEEYLIKSNFSYESGRIAAYKILENGTLPTAIFCIGDEVAFGVMDFFREKGINVPDDVSIVGFDSGKATSSVYCPLTSVYNPVREIGTIGTNLLIDKINVIKTDQIINNFEMKLIIKKSTKKIRILTSNNFDLTK